MGTKARTMWPNDPSSASPSGRAWPTERNDDHRDLVAVRQHRARFAAAQD